MTGFNALTGLYLISTASEVEESEDEEECVNALSGLYLISTISDILSEIGSVERVNALSGLYLIYTYILLEVSSIGETVCQCPLGLIFAGDRHFFSFDKISPEKNAEVIMLVYLLIF